MTKKSKKKALKTGFRSFETGRITTVYLDSVKDSENPVAKATISPVKVQQRKVRPPCVVDPDPKDVESFKQARVYPLDVWFTISAFVHPSDVYAFALICRCSYRIVRTAAFWLRIYRQYVSRPKMLPPCLKPKLINVKPGLKARVIRSLYMSCNEFRKRISTQVSKIERIERTLCRNCWWERIPSKKGGGESVWKYNFKLSRATSPLKDLHPLRHSITEHNSELNCCLLVLTSKYFIQLSSAIGLILTKFSPVTSSGDMLHHRIKMTMHTYRRDGKYHSHNAVHLVVDPVVDFSVYDWWHPSYPHPLDNY